MTHGKSEKMVERILKQQEEMKEKYGFYIHYVPNMYIAEDGNSVIDCHTHGLTESFGINEIQITTQIEPVLAKYVVHGVVKRIRETEEEVRHMSLMSGIVKDMDIMLIRAKGENNSDVIRVLFPNKLKEYLDYDPVSKKIMVYRIMEVEL